MGSFGPRDGIPRSIRLLAVGSALGVVAALMPARIWTPEVSAQTYPGYAVSHYVTSTSTTAAYNEGCALADVASLPPDAVVILDFGPAARSTTSSGTTYGALLFDKWGY